MHAGPSTQVRRPHPAKVSPQPDSNWIDLPNLLFLRGKNRRPKTTGRRKTANRSKLLAGLEHGWLEVMTLQQLVELSPIALGQRRGLRDVAPGDFQQPDQVVALEVALGFFERR